MLGQLFEGIIRLVFYVISLISNVIFVPIYAAVQVFIPDLHEFMGIFYTFFNEYLLRGVAFAKGVIINVTHIPVPLFNTLITLYLLKITTKAIRRMYKFIINMYGLFKGGPKYPNSNAGGY